MFVKPSSAFVEKPSLVASSSGSAKNARYARLFPSTRKRSDSRGGKPVAYLIAAPVTIWSGPTWMRANIAGLAIDEDPEAIRDVYAAAAARWVEEGHPKHAAFVPSHDSELVDAWFRLGFGASAVLAMRETGGAETFEADIEIRPGAPADFSEAARLELEMSESMVPSPSFSDVRLQTHEEVLAE